jgi:hypothetical protein
MLVVDEDIQSKISGDDMAFTILSWLREVVRSLMRVVQ